MRNAGTRRVGRWFLAVTLLLLGLVFSGATAAKPTADQWPARVQARGVSAQQDLRRRTSQSERKVEQAKVVPPALALLLALMAAPRRAVAEPLVATVETPRDASLWLVPYLFRPPPTNILVR
jgi:hypothetical protein